jgi:hypothetical protein
MHRFLDHQKTFTLQQRLFLLGLWIVYFLTFTILLRIPETIIDYRIHFLSYINVTELTAVIICLIVSTAALLCFPRFFPRLSVKTALGIIFLFGICFVYTHPGDADDFFINLWQAERWTVHGHNPFNHEFLLDGYQHHSLPQIHPVPFVPYGPLWLIINSILYSFIRTQSLLNIILYYKCLHLILYVVSCYFILRTAQKINLETVSYLTAVLISPLPLFTLIGTGHNDIWMFLGMSMFVFFIGKKKWIVGLVIVSIAVFIKYITLPIIPMYLAFLFSQLPLKKFLFLSAIWLISFLTTFISFESIFNFLPSLFIQGNGAGFSIHMAFYLLFPASTFSLWVRSSFLGLFALLYLVTLVLIFKNLPRISTTAFLKAAAMVLAGMYALAIHAWGAWYLTWIIPLLISFSSMLIRVFVLLGSLQLILLFPIWYVFSLFNELHTITFHQLLLFNVPAMVTLSLSLLIFLFFILYEFSLSIRKTAIG